MISYSCGHKRDYNPGHNIVTKKLCYDCRMSLVGTEISFIRFGAPPKNRCSWNYSENRPEKGVSVYLVRDGQILDSLRWEFADERPAYIGKGIVLGIGGDDEFVVEIITCRKATKKQIEKLSQARR